MLLWFCFVLVAVFHVRGFLIFLVILGSLPMITGGNQKADWKLINEWLVLLDFELYCGGDLVTVRLLWWFFLGKTPDVVICISYWLDYSRNRLPVSHSESKGMVASVL